VDELGRRVVRVLAVIGDRLRLGAGLWYSALLILCAVAACERKPPDTKVADSTAKPESISRVLAADDSLRFILHDENLPPGFPLAGKPLAIRNPYEGNKRAIQTGGQLYVAYNCIDCHGADGSGSMAPTFQDGRWHFGGSPGAVFESIYQGRPDGMPAWGGRISNDQIWMLTAYVRSLASGDLATENFTGKTVERTGH
jgi:cytochrome c oxidase cbb3-type subunit 3